jgi:hypothetical protein
LWQLEEAHWTVAALALPWLAMALVQLWRAGLGGRMARLRFVLAGISGVIGGLGVLVAVGPLNPLFGGAVRGPLLLDSLTLAYLLPGAMLGAAAWKMEHLHLRLRQGLAGAGVALGALWLVLEIRRFWRGPDLSVPGTSQAELYSYTVALLVIGVALLWQSIARRSGMLRRIAMGVIGVTVAKVFLVDASGLSGLMRVFSFLEFRRLDHGGRGDYNARHEMPFCDRRANYWPGALIQPPGVPDCCLAVRGLRPHPPSLRQRTAADVRRYRYARLPFHRLPARDRIPHARGPAAAGA